MTVLDAQLKDELEKLIVAGVQGAFRDVGLDHEEVYELRKDLTFLREQRLTCDEIKRKGVWYLVSAGLLFLGGLVVLGFKGWVNVP